MRASLFFAPQVAAMMGFTNFYELNLAKDLAGKNIDGAVLDIAPGYLNDHAFGAGLLLEVVSPITGPVGGAPTIALGAAGTANNLLTATTINAAKTVMGTAASIVKVTADGQPLLRATFAAGGATNLPPTGGTIRIWCRFIRYKMLANEFVVR